MKKTDEHGNLILIPLTSQIESDQGWREVEGPEWMPCPASSGPVVAVDYETYYSDKYSLATMSPWDYVHHDAFDAYLVALVRWDGFQWSQWVGQPKDAPFADVSSGYAWISHNASFDQLVHRRCVELNELQPHSEPDQWHCTADLSIWLQAGRSLKQAGANLLGVEVDKTVRDQMKTGEASNDAIREYAADDSWYSMGIWVKYGDKWPAREITMSRVQREANWAGVHVDYPSAEYAIKHLEAKKHEIRMAIPWGNRGAVASLPNFASECARNGIEAPLSLDADSASCRAWSAKHEKRLGWLGLVKRYTRANQMQGSLRLLINRRREDDTVPFELVYCKATHTKRWQHAGGLRIQNLDKFPSEGINLRHMFTPRPGYTFVIADLSQIEPRVLAWIAGDHQFLAYCAEGQSPYEAHARATMGYLSKEPLKHNDPSLYALAKARLLALGYGAGPPKFMEMAWAMCRLRLSEDDQTIILPDGDTMTTGEYNKAVTSGSDQGRELLSLSNQGKLVTLPSAKSAVYEFRRSSPLIADRQSGLWAKMEQLVRSNVGGHCKIDLKSGSHLRYFDIEATDREIKATVVKGSRNPIDCKKLYGGKIVENIVQATAREVFCDCLYRTTKIPDVKLVFSVHDEGIWEVPTKHADQRLQDIMHEMNTAPCWAEGLPVASEGELSSHYKK